MQQKKQARLGERCLTFVDTSVYNWGYRRTSTCQFTQKLYAGFLLHVLLNLFAFHVRCLDCHDPGFPSLRNLHKRRPCAGRLPRNRLSWERGRGLASLRRRSVRPQTGFNPLPLILNPPAPPNIKYSQEYTTMESI